MKISPSTAVLRCPHYEKGHFKHESEGVEVVEGTMCMDYIHMCLAIPPKYSVSTIVGYLKGKSAMIVFEKYSRLKRNFRGHSFWARGYYVSTVALDEAKIRKYIKESGY